MSNLLRFNVGSVTLRAEQAEGEQGDPRGVRVSIEAYNGGTMTVGSFGDVLVDVQGVRCGGQTPLLADHDSSLGGVIGFVQVAATGGRIAATGFVVPETDAARQIVALAKAGFEFQASIGLEPQEREFVRPGDMAQANGMQVRAGGKGLTVVRAGNLKEISILPLGADSTTRVDIAAALNKDNLNMSVNTEEIIRAERERIRTIEATCSGVMGSDPVTNSQVTSLKAQAINGDLDLPALNAALLGVVRGGRARQTPINPGLVTRHDNGKDVLAAALLIHAGQETAAERGFGERTAQLARDMRLTSFVDVIRAAWMMDGREPPRDNNELIQATAISTVSLPGILSNSMNKVLLGAYEAFPSAARMIGKKLTAKNFKQHTELRLTGDITMEPLPPAGEIKHAALGEQVYPWSVDTYARIITIDRRQVLDDDLSAFGTIPQMFGRGAALAQEDKFWSLVLANTGNFFGTDNANYIEGANTALSLDALGLAVTKMMQIVDDAGYPINVVPRYLVVPPSLKALADSIYRSTTVVAGYPASSDRIVPTANSFFGLAEPVVSPYLSNSNYTGSSSTAWYLFGAPDDVAAFGIGYLNGTEVPFVENVPSAPQQLAWCFRAFTDFGVCQLDHRGAVKSKGAA